MEVYTIILGIFLVIIIIIILIYLFFLKSRKDSFMNFQEETKELFNISSLIKNDDKAIQMELKFRKCPNIYFDEMFELSKKIYNISLEDESDKVFNQILDSSKSPILKENIYIVSLSTGDRPFAKKALDTVKAYSKKHDYHFIIRNKSFPIPDEIEHSHIKSPNWQKMFWIQELMNTSLPYDSVVVWVDDDLLITNDNIRLEDIISIDPSKNFYISFDRFSDKFVFPYRAYFNSGVFMVRNNQNGKNIVDQVVQSYYDYKGFYFSPYNDQTGIEYVYLKYYSIPFGGSNKKISSNSFAVFPHSVIQTLYNSKKWEPGQFIFHISGQNSNTRLKTIKNFKDKGYI